jgi:hypothetical protein
LRAETEVDVPYLITIDKKTVNQNKNSKVIFRSQRPPSKKNSSWSWLKVERWRKS